MNPTHTLYLKNMEASIATLRAAGSLADSLGAAAELLIASLRMGGKVMTCGNGGSAADASHLATELISRFRDERPPMAAICLVESGSSLSAIGNDYAFDQCFARQIAGLARPGDVVVIFSSSGNSENIRLALQAATDAGIASIAFLGKGGGRCAGLATVELVVPSDVTARVQEAHVLLYHTLCERIDEVLIHGQ